MKKGIAVVGCLTVDHIQIVDQLPQIGDLATICDYREATGGIICNTGIDLKILDPNVQVYACGFIGQDSDGQIVRTKLERYGVDISNLKCREKTSYSQVLFDKKSSTRTIFYYGGSNDTFDVDDVDFDMLHCSFFHVGYLLLMPMLDCPDKQFGTKMGRLLSTARDHGCRTSLDMVSERSGRAQSLLIPTLPYVDDLIINEVEASLATGLQLRDTCGCLNDERIYAALKWLKNKGVSHSVIIHAPEASFGTEDGISMVCENGAELPQGYIHGTVGAGDAFDAGVLLAHYYGLSLTETLRYGNASAVASLRSETANESMMPLEKVLSQYDLIRSGGITYDC